MRVATFIAGSWKIEDHVWTDIVNYFAIPKAAVPLATYDMLHATLRRKGLYINYAYELRFFNPNNEYSDLDSSREEAWWHEARTLLFTLHRYGWITCETPFFIVYRPWNQCLYKFESHEPRLKVSLSSLAGQSWLPATYGQEDICASTKNI